MLKRDLVNNTQGFKINFVKSAITVIFAAIAFAIVLAVANYFGAKKDFINTACNGRYVQYSS